MKKQYNKPTITAVSIDTVVSLLVPSAYEAPDERRNVPQRHRDTPFDDDPWTPN